MFAFLFAFFGWNVCFFHLKKQTLFAFLGRADGHPTLTKVGKFLKELNCTLQVVYQQPNIPLWRKRVLPYFINQKTLVTVIVNLKK